MPELPQQQDGMQGDPAAGALAAGPPQGTSEPSLIPAPGLGVVWLMGIPTLGGVGAVRWARLPWGSGEQALCEGQPCRAPAEPSEAGDPSAGGS